MSRGPRPDWPVIDRGESRVALRRPSLAGPDAGQSTAKLRKRCTDRLDLRVGSLGEGANLVDDVIERTQLARPVFDLLA